MKHIIVFFGLLFLALGASGQIYIDSYRFGAAPSATLLLDDYPNAAAAYSLRLLRTAYTGDCIVVRRSSNNDTLAIGFSGNYLDTAALKTFCASTNCFVRRWYDQSGNVRDGVQATSGNQAQIAINGALIIHGGESTIDGDINDFYQIPTHTAVSIFTVAKVDAINLANYIVGSPAGGAHYGGSAGGVTGIGGFDGTNAIYVAIEDLNEHLVSYFFTGTSGQIAVDGTVGVTGTLNSVSPTGLLDRININLNFNGKIKEIVIYSSSQLTNRTGIEGNMNGFYLTY